MGDWEDLYSSDFCVPWLQSQTQPEDLLEKLTWYKRANGLTLERVGVAMGRDPEQLADWLSGRHSPCRRNREEIESFLANRVLSLDTGSIS